jgi:hypothetical protein
MIEQVRNAIDKTVNQFQKYPYDFLSERDIQALLFTELRNETIGLRYHYDAGDKDRQFGFTDRFSIHPVTTEYHLYNGKDDRFDIAVLSEKQDSNSDIWRQPCSIAIEIKLWQPGYVDCGYSSDVEKLQNYQKYLQKKFDKNCTFMGIAILFIHPNVKKKSLAAIPRESSGDPYPENGVAVRFVTEASYWWEQQVAAPPTPDSVA